MQDIFKALRALRRLDAHLLLTAAHANLFCALDCFERANRGHQHELNCLARSVAGPLPLLNGGPQRWSRQRTLRETLECLVGSLARLPQAALPEDFAALWSAKDTTGCLDHFVMQRLRWQLRYELKLPAGLTVYWLHANRCTERPSDILLTLQAQNRLRGGITEARRVRVVNANLDSLGAAASSMARCKQLLTQMIAADPWPELNASAMLREPSFMERIRHVAATATT